ncbi:MAG TPA: trehalase family glycosidase [Bryobacteraceae bacterium]|jgi:alpha,alpha-trehalase|nr:trehalase family glycosidase [Bryobacteraceae bacterium]
MKTFWRASKLFSVAAAFCAAALLTAQTNQAPDIFVYIQQNWDALTRSGANIAKAAVDPKFQPDADGKWAVYIPKTEDISKVTTLLRSQMAPDDFKRITLLVLPEDTSGLTQQGLLYLPKPYVVPGGRFNEMYGWDSYFIQLGLLRDGRIELARDMAENFVYEVKHYGKVLNANRTYYMSRSQPPFLAEMVWNVYTRTHDRKWLADALPAVENYNKFWNSGKHFTETGLARYYDSGEGPAPEVLSGERTASGLTHYDLLKQYFQTHEVTDYDLAEYYDKATGNVTPLFYKGDRSMRESGFDPSNRFGPFNLDIIHYDPVCLNSLLYMTEMQIAEIHDALGKKDGKEYRDAAQLRAQRINHEMWSAEDGLYFDYNFETRKVRKYPFLTTFYPLWAGIASKEQAAAVRNNLKLFERDGGLQTSTYVSGNQWDSPFGWAPLQMIAVEGLRRYGYKEDADRISLKFLSMVVRQFLVKGFIVEKYDVVRPGADVSSNIHFGYSTNEAGFGWTNAVFTTLYDQLGPADQAKIKALFH